MEVRKQQGLVGYKYAVPDQQEKDCRLQIGIVGYERWALKNVNAVPDQQKKGNKYSQILTKQVHTGDDSTYLKRLIMWVGCSSGIVRIAVSMQPTLDKQFENMLREITPLVNCKPHI